MALSITPRAATAVHMYIGARMRWPRGSRPEPGSAGQKVGRLVPAGAASARLFDICEALNISLCEHVRVRSDSVDAVETPMNEVHRILLAAAVTAVAAAFAYHGLAWLMRSLWAVASDLSSMVRNSAIQGLDDLAINRAFEFR